MEKTRVYGVPIVSDPVSQKPKRRKPTHYNQYNHPVPPHWYWNYFFNDVWAVELRTTGTSASRDSPDGREGDGRVAFG